MRKTDDISISISLDHVQAILIRRWLDRFNERTRLAYGVPVIKGSTLSIHPADFPNVLSFAEPEDCTELEFYRIRRLGSVAIAAALASKRDTISIQLRTMTLSALEGLQATPRSFDGLPEFIDPDMI